MQVIGCSLTGASHERLGIPCQDAYAYDTPIPGTVVMAVGDGAGCAPCAEIGAATATLAAVSYTAGLLRNNHCGYARSIWARTLREVLAHARARLEHLAGEQRREITDFATTLLISIVTPRYVCTAHVGDGAIVGLLRSGRLVVYSTPPRRRYVNETPFLTIPQYERYVHTTIVRRRHVRALAILTDGVEMVSVYRVGNIAHPGFFLPMFRLAAHGRERIPAVLQSPLVCERSDDDKTLVIATL